MSCHVKLTPPHFFSKSLEETHFLDWIIFLSSMESSLVPILRSPVLSLLAVSLWCPCQTLTFTLTPSVFAPLIVSNLFCKASQVQAKEHEETSLPVCRVPPFKKVECNRKVLGLTLLYSSPYLVKSYWMYLQSSLWCIWVFIVYSSSCLCAVVQQVAGLLMRERLFWKVTQHSSKVAGLILEQATCPWAINWW